MGKLLLGVIAEFQSTQVKSTVRAETETPVSVASIRRIPRVPADMPLYDILNDTVTGGNTNVNNHLLTAKGEKPDRVIVDIDKATVLTVSPPTSGDAVTNGLPESSDDIEDAEVIGIITLEDVFEELLQDTCRSISFISSTSSINPEVNSPKGRWKCTL
ncbi:hypothetical protein K7X08_032031 [Anisodus acutangulus]|uniref:Uncharacterized protein n=1 Tax=Anisodus acutangulus TaxID=402998 RepID=A0A9Q1MR65_9SOLA|nr:hypothetical protein K7X08_032031 [Anisodus acutangulus]